jgi:hypothetical protein
MWYSGEMALSLQTLALSLWFGGGQSMLYGTRAIFAAMVQ